MEASSDLKQGVTGVVSAKESDHWTQEQGKKLQKFLHDSGFFESEESAQTRERVLGRLDYMVKSFVAGIPGTPEKPGGKIFTFGSYRLGVHDRGADIDALCVVPRHVTRKDFFSVFYEQLQHDPAVQEITKVEDSYVPLIKMKFHGISIDVTFARLGVPVIRDNINLLNDTILRAMDEKCIVSLNGSRVTDAILSLVPAPDAFHGALRAVKLWAKRRSIYGATYGYFGGVAFAICVARVCQMYPSACSYDILRHFFEQFSVWKWPAPVLLRPVADLNYNLKVWDPKVNPVDRYHKMPVITPAYPSMCSTHSVTQSTAAHITSELVRGCEIMKSGGFEPLFEPADFTRKYKLFLEVSALATSTSGFLAWSGFVESKLRMLTAKLEGIENITAALIIPKCFRKLAVVVSETRADDRQPAASPAPLTPDLKNEMDLANNKLGSSTKPNCGINSSNIAACSNTDSACFDRCKTVAVDSDEGVGDAAIENLPGIGTDLQEEVCGSANKDGEASGAKTPVDENTTNTSHLDAGANDAAPGKRKHDDDFERAKMLKANGPRIVDGAEPCTATWFIALNVLLTNNTGKKLYIDGPIRDFLTFMNLWEQKTAEMSIKVASCRRKEVQKFVKSALEEASTADNRL